MKTIEEKRTALLAECATLCPNEHNTAHLEVGMLKRQSMGSVFYWLHVDGLSTIAIHEKATDDHIFAAYRILGLAERDAVAESEDKRHELRTAIESLVGIKYELESRNAALVAALQDVHDIAKDSILHGASRNDCSRIFDKSFEAIAANTEKGGSNE